MILSGAFLPIDFLKSWGLVIFLVCMALITWGLWPYSHLKRLENHPYRIIIDEEKLRFIKGKEAISIPLDNISQIKYVEKKEIYGIEIYLNEKDLKKLYSHHRLMLVSSVYYPRKL